MTRLTSILGTIFLGLGAGPVLANEAVGLWLTGPDKYGNVAHVEAKPCGGAVCGTIIKAFDSSGKPTSSPNIGRRVFWDMKSAGGGEYKGRAYVPALKKDFNATMQVKGNSMVVRGCAGPVCKKQVWNRVK